MSTVYVTTQGAYLQKYQERLVVKKGNQIVRWFHTKDIEQLIILGNISLTAPVITFLLKNKIDTVFLSYYGKYKGRLIGEFGNNINLRLSQFGFLNSEKNKIYLAREYVKTKIDNQIFHLQKRNYRLKNDILAKSIMKLKSLLRKNFGELSNLEAIRGWEGIASKYYFEAFPFLIGKKDFKFVNRNRRPPKDEINALLSLGYTLLMNLVSTQAYIVGVEPFYGALHEIAYGRQSFVLDIMEEYRPLIDDLVINLINLNRIRKIHFRYNFHSQENDEDEIRLPVMLSQEGMKIFVTSLNNLFAKKFYYPEKKSFFEMKQIVKMQIYTLSSLFQKKGDYHGFVWRTAV